MCRFKNKKGFSLIELMVVVAIMGILASIGIPQYLAYRNNAAYGTLTTELATISRSVMSCLSARGWNECTTSLTELGLDTFDYGQTQGAFGTQTIFGRNNAAMNRFCADIIREIGGTTYNACIQIDTMNGSYELTTNQRDCVFEDMNDNAMIIPSATDCDGTMAATDYSCNANAVESSGCADDCGDVIQLGRTCTTDQYCQDLNGGNGFCAVAMNGTCANGNGTGECS